MIKPNVTTLFDPDQTFWRGVYIMSSLMFLFNSGWICGLGGNCPFSPGSTSTAGYGNICGGISSLKIEHCMLWQYWLWNFKFEDTKFGWFFLKVNIFKEILIFLKWISKIFLALFDIQQEQMSPVTTLPSYFRSKKIKS